MSRFSSLFSKEIDPTDLLNKHFNCETKTDKGKSYKSWRTPYGVSFSDQGLKIMWFYEYDSDLTYSTRDNSSGVMSGIDVANALEKLQIDPDKLRKKPDSIIKLEQLTGLKAIRHYTKFGSWYIACDNYSLFNNVFNTQLGYTDGPDSFEIWFLKKEEEPREYVPLDRVIDALQSFEYIVQS